MVMRLGAAICGTAVLLACSSTAMARTEIAVASRAVNKASKSGSGSRQVASGGHDCRRGVDVQSFEPDIERVAAHSFRRATIHLRGLPRSKPVCARCLVGPPGLKQNTPRRVYKKATSNDVGPFHPAVIDFNKQTMRYFDPSGARHYHNVKVTALAGDR